MHRIYYAIINAKNSIMVQLLVAAVVLFFIISSETRWKVGHAKQLQAQGTIKGTKCANSCPKEQWKQVVSKTLTNIKMARKANTLGKALLHLSRIQQQLENIQKLLSNPHMDSSKFEPIFSYFNDLKAPRKRDVNVCPEKYDENRRDYPLFRHGWYKLKCKDKDLKKVLSIGIVAPPEESPTRLMSTLKDIGGAYPGINVYVAGFDASKLSPVGTIKLVALQPTPGGKPIGWNDIIKTSRTKFLLIGRNMTHLKPDDAQLERLVRQLSDTNLDVAGGASRDINGRWRLGCEQMYLQNFRLQYTAGYHSSMYSCMLCDIVGGPFVIRRRKFVDAFDETLSEDAQFEDLFIKRFLDSKKSWLCPDSMFFTQVSREDASRFTHVWKKIGKKYNVSEVILNDGDGHILPCNDTEVVKTLLNSPCVQRDLNDAIHHVMKVCREAKVTCELSEGSVMGAVKFGKSLPWDVDADLVVRVASKSQEKLFKDKLETNGYKVTVFEKIKMWVMKTKYMRVEMRLTEYSQWVDTYNYKQHGLPPTTVLFDGEWLPTPGNPGLTIRNRYGHEVYQHAEHWSVLKLEHGRQAYKSGSFKKCLHPGHNACMDQYPADGNLDFME